MQSLLPCARVRVAIVGFAGGHVPEQCRRYLNALLFAQMVARAEEIITRDWGLQWTRVHLISGGAAWADHVAVALFLAHPDATLTVHAPAQWDATTGRFLDNGRGADWKTNPAHLTNALHERFAAKTGRQAFLELRDAHSLGASINATDKAGFHARNNAIAAQADRMMAFSWSDGAEPTDGGTRYTWERCGAHHKIHVSLTDGVNA